MGIFFWQYDLDPEFPFSMLEYTTYGNKDKMHWHNYLQVAMCVEGCGKYIFTSKEYDVAKGDIFIVDNFENHVALSEPPESIHFLFAIFIPDLIASPGSRLFDFEYLSPFWYNSSTFCNKIDHSTDTGKQIGSIMMEIRDIWTKKEDGYKHLVDANLKRILGLLIKHYKITDPAYSTSGLQSHIKIQPALNYINQHFTENITLEDVSSTIHMSESRFRHLFKEITHIGFKEYITFLRLNEAKKLLVVTDMNISDIVYNIGYTNVYQFYRIFTKHVSMTPAEYRKYYSGNFVDEVFPKNSRETAT